MKRRAADGHAKERRAKRRNVAVAAAISQSNSTALVRQLEYKVTDTTFSASAINTTGGVVSLINSLARGTSSLNEFIGNVIKPAGMQIRYNIRAGDASNVVRVLVFQWLSSGTPVMADVYQTPANWLSAINVDNKQYINVLHDRNLIVNEAFTGALSQAGPEKAVFVKGKRLLPIEFISATATPRKGGIYVALSSDSNAGTHPSVSMYSRTTYVD